MKNYKIGGDIKTFMKYEGASQLLPQLREEVDLDVVHITQITKGGNNGLFIIRSTNDEKLVVKFYQRDKRTRLEREYGANSFLLARNFCVARPVIKNEEYNFGIYSFEDGEHVNAEEASVKDVDQLADFLVRLHQYKRSQISEQFPRCIAAMVNVQEILDDNESRISTFQKSIKNGTAHPLVKELLDSSPYIKDIRDLTDSILAKSLDTSWHIPLDRQRLSPVDFGFHNALFRKGKSPVILDLEYFGWDDPLHPVADFVAHDQTLGLSSDLRKHFIAHYIEGVGLSMSEQTRLDELVRLTDVKWIAIYLLSITPKYLSARSFAAAGSFDAEQYIREQVQKIEKRKRSVVLAQSN